MNTCTANRNASSTKHERQNVLSWYRFEIPQFWNNHLGSDCFPNGMPFSAWPPLDLFGQKVNKQEIQHRPIIQTKLLTPNALPLLTLFHIIIYGLRMTQCSLCDLKRQKSGQAHKWIFIGQVSDLITKLV